MKDKTYKWTCISCESVVESKAVEEFKICNTTLWLFLCPNCNEQTLLNRKEVNVSYARWRRSQKQSTI